MDLPISVPACGEPGPEPGRGRSPHLAAPDADLLDGRVAWDASRIAWLASMATAGAVGGALFATPGAAAAFVVSTALVLLLGHSLGSHRLLIHRSYACPLWLERMLVWFGVQAGLSGPLALLAAHDLRDHAQRQPRCHDFLSHARPWWQDGPWQLFCRLELRGAPAFALEPWLANDRFLQVLERTWRWQHVPTALVFFLVGGWGWVFWGVCLRVVACNVGHWAVGHLAHRRGGARWHVRGAAVQGYNVPFCALLTMGESWHNNHHAFPGSARLGLAPGEWDPGWWLLVALRRIGLVWDLTTPQDLPPRAALVRVGNERGDVDA